MRLEKLTIHYFRSIERAEIVFPKDKPVIVFGPNNVGKSNILRAIDCMLGERYPSYIDFKDSDFFLRDRGKFPKISFSAEFDDYFKASYPKSTSIHFTTDHEFEHYKTKQKLVENTFHYEDGSQMFLSAADREKCQVVLVDATRDIGRQLSYFSQFSILSKMAKRMHEVLVEQTKQQLDEHFQNLKGTFEAVPEYKAFHKRLQRSFESNVEGFEHKLEIDLSAYDPNNYFHSLRIIAKENDQIRSFDEFGTGEQQVLLMSFVKAYAETFKGENFILAIEEPEAHLHPLAQRWLAQNINQISRENVQVIVTTHSPEFLDIDNLEGFVRTCKLGPVTTTLQNTAEELSAKCVKLGANAQKASATTVVSFYKTNTFYDQLKGFFAKKIILVEGPSESFALRNYFANYGFDLIKNGVEIIDCRGKSQIARNFRLFSAYDYDVFCLFDSDDSDKEKQRGNEELGQLLGFDSANMKKDSGSFICDAVKKYGYFGIDFEHYMRTSIKTYTEKEAEIEGGKVLKAKIISEQNRDFRPPFIEDVAKALKLVAMNEEQKNS